MKRVQQILFGIAAAAVLAYGCRKEDGVTHPDLGYAYFPTDTGRYIDYSVDSLRVHHAANDTDTVSLHYDLREKITEHFNDPEGREAERLLRYVKDPGGVWQVKDVWWQVRTSTQAERTEENVRRLKLVFPPRSSAYWNTNATNTSDPLELTYDEVDVPWSINGMSFDSTTLVTTTYPNNFVRTVTYHERYAKHIGLVYREVDSTERQTTHYDRWFIKQVITGHGP